MFLPVVAFLPLHHTIWLEVTWIWKSAFSVFFFFRFFTFYIGLVYLWAEWLQETYLLWQEFFYVILYYAPNFLLFHSAKWISPTNTQMPNKIMNLFIKIAFLLLSSFLAMDGKAKIGFQLLPFFLFLSAKTFQHHRET